ncbi:uncharacterized protein N7458_002782 [Penicillium daleae]|uniref:Fungal lipase-type domain-containing protein n=1 Tax=Penicillium daleae TaxID=63821 RepID=A0AAD6G736_9EURO|nr:uncharacterized protein N7458_002782 [Penicillium daleae]KAJ5461230.1 hypothetical protein N7458_002782 [Penicillium daleae]
MLPALSVLLWPFSLSLQSTVFSTSHNYPVQEKPLIGLPQDVTAPVLRTLSVFSEYSAAATCINNFNATAGAKVTCDPGKCPIIEFSDTEIIGSFQGINPGNTTGFIAIDRTHQRIILSFRGSEYSGNFKTDGNYTQIAVPEICPDCLMHGGFLSAWNSASSFIMPTLDCAVKVFPHFTVAFTGHSLGGALSTVGATYLRKANRTIDLFTFGSPQIGNYSVAEVITNTTMGLNYRSFGNFQTCQKKWQYSQSSPEYWITSNNTVKPTPADVEVIEGIDNKTGNLGQTGCDITAHNWYIGNMTGCSRDGASKGSGKGWCDL